MALGVVLWCLLGAEIAFAPNSSVPNPNNLPYAVHGSGTYQLNQGEFPLGVRFYAENTKSGDKISNNAEVNFQQKTWNKTLTSVAPGNYDCYGVLAYVVIENNEIKFLYKETIKKNVDIK